MMAKDFFNETREFLTKKLNKTVSDEEVKAILHYTETKYKAEDNLLPIRHYRDEYEKYSFQVLKNFSGKIDDLLESYRNYKRQQKIKAAAALFLETKVIPEISKFTRQKTCGYHGLEHTELVALRAIDVSISLGHEKNNELIPVILAAAIHDCARTDDNYNEHHGPDAAKMPEVRNFISNPVFGLTENQKLSVLNAAVYHTVALPDDTQSYDYVQKSLFDADRIRLSWEKSYAPQYIFTPRGHELSSMNPYRVMDYLYSWDNIMREAGIAPVYGSLVSKYQIRYNRKIGHKRVAFINPNRRVLLREQNTH